VHLTQQDHGDRRFQDTRHPALPRLVCEPRGVITCLVVSEGMAAGPGLVRRREPAIGGCERMAARRQDALSAFMTDHCWRTYAGRAGVGHTDGMLAIGTDIQPGVYETNRRSDFGVCRWGPARQASALRRRSRVTVPRGVWSDRCMRAAVLADIHGNLPALEAVLKDVNRAGVDIVVLNGDIADGPMPVQTLERLVEIGERAIWVRGNTDRWLVEAFGGRLHVSGLPTNPSAEWFAWPAASAASQSNRVPPSSWAARSIRGAAEDTARRGRSGAARAATLATGFAAAIETARGRVDARSGAKRQALDHE
jgi:hypothetical protein